MSCCERKHPKLVHVPRAISCDTELCTTCLTGPELAAIDALLLPNTLLLELPGGWHAHPPPSGQLSTACSLPVGAIESARASSVVCNVHMHLCAR